MSRREVLIQKTKERDAKVQDLKDKLQCVLDERGTLEPATDKFCRTCGSLLHTVCPANDLYTCLKEKCAREGVVVVMWETAVEKAEVRGRPRFA